MENYTPENDDEVGFKAGEKIEVVHKNMDGWWKIRSDMKGCTGESERCLRDVLSLSLADKKANWDTAQLH